MTARVYLDHHATTPLAPEARAAMLRVLDEVHGNPSSVHTAGRRARRVLEDAREALADVTGATPRELVFTSGGTEAVHLAVRGVGEARGVTQVWCDPGAHPCLRAGCEALCLRRGATLSWIPLHATGEGSFDLDALAAALQRDALVAVSLVQHETGAITAWPALRDLLHARGAVAVVDAAQALGKVPLDLGAMGAAAVTLSAHKIGGPAGVGALWLRAGERIAQQITGGAQERGVRAGTENISGIAGFGAAATAIPTRLAAMPSVAQRRNVIEAALAALDGVRVNGASRARVATACHLAVAGVEGHALVAALDLQGFEVSSGAACSSGRADPSESLARIYASDPARVSGALRVTLGPETTDDEAARAAAVIPSIIARLRALSG